MQPVKKGFHPDMLFVCGIVVMLCALPLLLVQMFWLQAGMGRLFWQEGAWTYRLVGYPAGLGEDGMLLLDVVRSFIWAGMFGFAAAVCAFWPRRHSARALWAFAFCLPCLLPGLVVVRILIQEPSTEAVLGVLPVFLLIPPLLFLAAALRAAKAAKAAEAMPALLGTEALPNA